MTTLKPLSYFAALTIITIVNTESFANPGYSQIEEFDTTNPRLAIGRRHSNPFGAIKGLISFATKASDTEVAIAKLKRTNLFSPSFTVSEAQELEFKLVNLQPEVLTTIFEKDLFKDCTYLHQYRVDIVVALSDSKIDHNTLAILAPFLRLLMDKPQVVRSKSASLDVDAEYDPFADDEDSKDEMAETTETHPKIHTLMSYLAKLNTHNANVLYKLATSQPDVMTYLFPTSNYDVTQSIELLKIVVTMQPSHVAGFHIAEPLAMGPDYNERKRVVTAATKTAISPIDA